MSKRTKKNIPELLAPAGTKEAFIAAVESGADAIYMGGEILNARMNAGNFSLPEMKEAIDFAHKRLVKVYVTVNTLVKDDEMDEALAYCCQLYEMGADALIIQDLGLGYAVKQALPDFPIHLSTQGSVYDLAGVEAAKKLGYERVVIARELSLDEIKNICQGTDVPVEVFCHGAICICYSGQCQMSRAIGGRSGNRGGCAQPCRLAYEMSAASGEKKYHLSPADMNFIDHLGELAEAGVSSLKIEGRMKSPEYVAVVTSIYRKYLDEYGESGKYEVSDEDRLALTQIFNRGFTTAYLNGADENFMSGDKPKNKGVLMGNVIAVEKIKNKSDRFIVTAALWDDVNKNDVLEIGDAHCTVTFIDNQLSEVKSGGGARNNNVSTTDGAANSIVKLGDVVGDVKVGDEVYRIISDVQMRDAEKAYKNKDWHSGKYIRKNSIAWDVVSLGDGNIKVIARSLKGEVSAEIQAGPFEESEGDATERIRDALVKTGGTAFETLDIRLRGDFNYKIPVSALNAARREAIEKLENALCESARMNRNTCECKREETHHDDKQFAPTLELYFYTAKDFIEKEINSFADKTVFVNIILPAVELLHCYDDAIKKAQSINAEIIPYIDNISKGEENDLIEKNFDCICEIAKDSGIYVGNINWIGRFANAGVKVFADYGLNKYNSYTEVALEKLGATYAVDSLENFEIGNGNYGRAPLMTTEHSFDEECLIDRKGAEYHIVKRGFSDQEIIVLARGKDMREALEEQMKLGDKARGRFRVYI